jgi:hypothetical protein
LYNGIKLILNRQHNGQKKNVQKEKQRSTKHTYEAKVRVTQIPLMTGVNSGAPEGHADPAPFGKVEVITSKMLRLPPCRG